MKQVVRFLTSWFWSIRQKGGEEIRMKQGTPGVITRRIVGPVSGVFTFASVGPVSPVLKGETCL